MITFHVIFPESSSLKATSQGNSSDLVHAAPRQRSFWTTTDSQRAAGPEKIEININLHNVIWFWIIQFDLIVIRPRLQSRRCFRKVSPNGVGETHTGWSWTSLKFSLLWLTKLCPLQSISLAAHCGFSTVPYSRPLHDAFHYNLKLNSVEFALFCKNMDTFQIVEYEPIYERVKICHVCEPGQILKNNEEPIELLANAITL